MKLLELAGLIALIAVFFYAAFSTLPNVLKIIVIAVSLFASGVIIARLTKSSNYYGLVIVRGKYGFGLMKSIAQRHPKIVNALADLGLSLGFGALYSLSIFKNSPKKFLAHLAVLVLLFAGASFTSAVSTNPLYLQVAGVLFGLAGVGFLSIALNAFSILTVPNTPAGVLPVVPGVTVPFEAIFAIALIAIVHETAHGVLFFIEKLKVKHSGVLLLGFLPIGAFVEPDEKKFAKHNATGRRRILVAGSASNFYTMLILLPFSAIAFLLVSSLVSGIAISAVTPGSPADSVLAPGDVITGVNGGSTLSLSTFITQLQQAGSGGTVALQLLDGGSKQLTLDSEGKMGVQVSNYVAPQNGFAYAIAAFFAEVLKWSVLLSLALSIINLLPIFVTDGHHLVADEIKALLPGNPQLAKLTTSALAGLIVLLLLLNMLPFIR